MTVTTADPETGPHGWAGLTPTQRKVARLASQALTNRQIAHRLFLSPHTVNYHLRRIFRELGISSRVELVRIVEEQGGPRPDDGD